MKEGEASIARRLAAGNLRDVAKGRTYTCRRRRRACCIEPPGALLKARVSGPSAGRNRGQCLPAGSTFSNTYGPGPCISPAHILLPHGERVSVFAEDSAMCAKGFGKAARDAP